MSKDLTERQRNRDCAGTASRRIVEDTAVLLRPEDCTPSPLPESRSAIRV
jgi:hypothetical protein